MTQTLVTVQEYRDITKDVNTSASAVSEALEDALDLLEGPGGLDRPLRSEERTETTALWYVDGVGYVYPLATPATAVPASASYVVDVDGARLLGVPASTLNPGDTSVVVINAAVPDFFGDGPQRYAYATYTYTGGYTHDTLPVTLRRAIARLARGLISLTPARVLQLGAEDVSVGDVHVKYGAITSELDSITPGLAATLRGFKRRRVR